MLDPMTQEEIRILIREEIAADEMRRLEKLKAFFTIPQPSGDHWGETVVPGIFIHEPGTIFPVNTPIWCGIDLAGDEQA